MPTKREDGIDFPSEAYAYVPDPDAPSTWKLRLWEDPEQKETARQVGMAMAALGPGGFRGNRVQIPREDLPAVKRKVRAAWRKVHPDTSDDDMPGHMREATAPTGVRVLESGEVEAPDRIEGRLLETRESAEDGHRVFRVQVIRYGKSRNSRNYPETVMRSASRLYEGAKAYDHHRTDGELKTSTIAGLVGTYRNVEAGYDGLEADLHLLPGATHVAEALDASLTNQQRGLPPLVGISHDVMAHYRRMSEREGNRQMLEATEILSVNSTDIVADPAAGGMAMRMVAGGEGDEDIEVPEEVPQELEGEEQGGSSPPLSEPQEKGTEVPSVPPQEAASDETEVTGDSGDAHPEEDVVADFEQLLELLNGATEEQKATLAATLGVTTVSDTKDKDESKTDDTGEGESTELVPVPPVPTTESTTRSTEAGEVPTKRDSFVGRLLIGEVTKQVGLSDGLRDHLVKTLPAQFTESEVVSAAQAIRDVAFKVERANLKPEEDIRVGPEDFDKKRARLDAFFASNWQEGYNSFRQAYLDFTDNWRDAVRLSHDDMTRQILRDTFGTGYDTARRRTESVTTTTWDVALGDSITRRMVQEYQRPALRDWERIVSSIVPVNDFRTQRIDRIGGYITLPTVAEGAPYQPLPTPTDEEASYALTKRGGTEVVTFEAVANDDVRAIAAIPSRLGRAAAITLYRFVWDFLVANAATSYDSVALFDAGHTNTTAAALGQAGLSTLRALMRDQAAYGQATDILGITPRYLVVPAELEEIGFQLTTSAVAIPSTAAGPSNTPNLHQGLELIVVDYLVDANDWFLIADPATVPTIEVGFYAGRRDPELFSQTNALTGSVFTADSVTWKLRHIYSGAVLDHRGFQRGTQ